MTKHLFFSIMFAQTGCNLTWFVFPTFNFFTIQLICFWMHPKFRYFTNFEFQLTNIRQISIICFLVFLFSSVAPFSPFSPSFCCHWNPTFSQGQFLQEQFLISTPSQRLRNHFNLKHSFLTAIVCSRFTVSRQKNQISGTTINVH